MTVGIAISLVVDVPRVRAGLIGWRGNLAAGQVQFHPTAKLLSRNETIPAIGDYIGSWRRTAAVLWKPYGALALWGFCCARRPQAASPPGEGTAMRIGWVSLRRDRTGRLAAVGLIAPLISVAGLAAWLLLPEASDAGGENAAPVSSAILLTAQDTAAETSSGQASVKQASPSPTLTVPADQAGSVGMANAPEATAETGQARSLLDGLRIASQSWRRGGLGSKALVTLTLRNANSYAVKDIEIACAFIRRDGSPVTERTRLIPDTIAMKSRKTYPNMLIGFININANKAKCSVVTASRI